MTGCLPNTVVDALDVCLSLFVVPLLLVQFQGIVVIFLIFTGMPLIFFKYVLFIGFFLR